MVNSLLRPLRRWPVLEAALSRLAGRFTTHPSDESIAPANFEVRFMKLQAQERFDEMWEMLAEDAQRAWGGREAFIRDMPRFGDGMELLDMQVVSVDVLESWTDHAHERRYKDVARMVMRYRIKQQWRESTFDREVHLIPAAGGWRTLCYPAASKAVSSAGSR
jgi:hypothetical protein